MRLAEAIGTFRRPRGDPTPDPFVTDFESDPNPMAVGRREDV
jgi:hypothetical protein